MSIFNHIQRCLPGLSKKREAFYSSIVQELEKDEVDKDLMSKAFVQADGDEKKAKARYIRMRADVLFHQEQCKKAEEIARNEAVRLAKIKVEVGSACRRAEQERQRQEQEQQRQEQEQKEQKEKTIEMLRRDLSRDKGVCPNCLTIYRLDDYLPDVPVWLCSSCKQALPKE